MNEKYIVKTGEDVKLKHIKTSREHGFILYEWDDLLFMSRFSDPIMNDSGVIDYNTFEIGMTDEVRDYSEANSKLDFVIDEGYIDYELIGDGREDMGGFYIVPLDRFIAIADDGETSATKLHLKMLLNYFKDVYQDVIYGCDSKEIKYRVMKHEKIWALVVD